MSEMRKQDDPFFRSISGTCIKLKSGRDSNHEFNEELINNIRHFLWFRINAFKAEQDEWIICFYMETQVQQVKRRFNKEHVK